MPNGVPSHLLQQTPVIDKIFNDSINLLLAIGPDAVCVAWDGCVPWVDTNAENPVEFSGVMGQFRRVGKPYEYLRGEVKVRGYDVFVILRTSDILAGKLSAQTLVTVTSVSRPHEPPKQYMVRMIDEQGDTNAFVYLLELREDGTVEPETTEPTEPDTDDSRGDRHLTKRERRIAKRW